MEPRRPALTRRQEIVEAALDILNTKGVHRLTAAEIASAVGIADGTIFRHFRNKEEIITAAIDLYESLLFQDFPPAHADPLERLHMFFVERLMLLQKHPAILHLGSNDRLAEAAGETGAQRMQQLVMRSMSFVHASVVEAQTRKQIASDLPPEALVWLIVGTMRGLQGAWQLGMITPDANSIDEAWRNLATLLRRSAAAS